ncbi:MAG: hypothetical protein ACRDHD_09115 [Candidatus Limnocylindria bacterium]
MSVHEAQASRLRDIEHRLNQIEGGVRRAGASLETYEEAIGETEALLEEAKRLARDAHTGALARIAISAGWLLGRLERGRSQARKAARAHR